MINWQEFDKELINAFEVYLPDYKQIDELTMQNIICDIIESKEKYEFAYYKEYFMYNFHEENENVRSTFCGEGLYKKCVYNSLKDFDDKAVLFKNKMKTYEALKPFYKRDIIEVKDFSDYQKFVDFANKNRTFIVKETLGSLGRNVNKITISKELDAKTVFLNILRYGGCICESWIEQSDIFKQFNESSVNTVRIVGIYDGEKVHRMHSIIRTGRSGAIVDNAAQGGIFAEVNVDTGEVVSDGYTEINTDHFEVHPDSKVKFKGFQIPYWDELIELINEMHKLCYPISLAGWDLALTDNGWVLVEGNSKPFMCDMQLLHYKTCGVGLKKEFQFFLDKFSDK